MPQQPSPQDKKLQRMEQYTQLGNQQQAGDLTSQAALMQHMQALYGISHQEQVTPGQMAETAATTGAHNAATQHATTMLPYEEASAAAQTHEATSRANYYDANAASAPDYKAAAIDEKNARMMHTLYPAGDIPDDVRQSMAGGMNPASAMQHHGQLDYTKHHNAQAATAESAGGHFTDPAQATKAKDFEYYPGEFDKYKVPDAPAPKPGRTGGVVGAIGQAAKYAAGPLAQPMFPDAELRANNKTLNEADPYNPMNILFGKRIPTQQPTQVAQR